MPNPNSADIEKYLISDQNQMEAVLLRTGPVPALDAISSTRIPSSLSIHGSADFSSLTFSPRLNFSDRSGRSCKTIRRAMSESDMMYGVEASGRMWIGGGGCKSARIVEEWLGGSEAGEMIVERDFEIGEDSVDEDVEDGVYGGGRGTGKANSGGGGGGDNYNDNDDCDNGMSSKCKVDVYYKQMLKLNPMDPLLLRNYARFLYEVMKDIPRADEYYGRAILANPGDGEVLGLYAKFIWETQKDYKRAKSYFDQAVQASPENCMVMGMFAEFMWESVEDEEDNDEDVMIMNEASNIPARDSLATITSY